MSTREAVKENTLLELSMDETPKCTGSHKRLMDRPCLIEVTHWVRETCGGVEDGLCCYNVYLTNLEYFAVERKCGHCQRLASECWTMVPV